MLSTDGALLAASLEDGALRSDDGGRTWRGWNFGLLDWRVNALCDGQGAIWAGTDCGLFRSDSAGRSWRDVPAFDDSPILSLARAAGGALLIGTEACQLFRLASPDGTRRLVYRADAPLNAIRVHGCRIALPQGKTVMLARNDGGFAATQCTDATAIAWLNDSQLLVGTEAGLVSFCDAI